MLSLDQVPVISSQKLKPTLLNPTDLKLLLTKLEDQLMPHPSLTVPQWKGENIWYMYKFYETSILYVIRHLVVCVAYPLSQQIIMV